jgi:septal ring factor EnvC (AmiA/AmiB activator)
MVTSVTSPATASRGLKASPLRRISEIVLVVGTVAATAAASSGSVWVVRMGVATAITAALLACAFAWRELNTARHAHAQAILEATRKHGAALTEERTRNAGVVTTLRSRISDAGKMIEKQRVTIARLQQQISGLRDDRAYLRGEIQHREKVISGLRETVREREAELIALRDEPDAEVHHMPRRVLAEHESIWRELHATDALVAPTLQDVTVIELGMPNYEADRQLA